MLGTPFAQSRREMADRFDMPQHALAVRAADESPSRPRAGSANVPKQLLAREWHNVLRAIASQPCEVLDVNESRRSLPQRNSQAAQVGIDHQSHLSALQMQDGALSVA